MLAAAFSPMKPELSGVATNSAPSAFALRTSAEICATFPAMSSQALDCTRAILTRRLMVWSSGDGVEHRIELAGAVERVEIVAAADMLAVDPDLRHGVLAAGLLRHLLALGRSEEHTSELQSLMRISYAVS